MLKIFFILVFLLGINVFIVNGQNKSVCNCWLAKIDRKVSSPNDCKDRKDLTNEEVLEVMECLLNQKGNKSPYWAVSLRNDISQTFGPSPVEVVSLFYVSYLFQENKDFASAIVLLYDNNDEEFNSRKAVKIAYNAYRKWFEKVKKIGLEEARRQELDPLADSNVRWY